ncbi:MAG: hypothetical protein DBX59_12130 [Bacillota bacterium]|nr:MAG: hypothetical protein DBX59_12130 [Bacillota bacterium]
MEERKRISNEVLDKYTTDLDTVITRENVLYLCESMALCALKHMSAYRGDYSLRMYYNLVGDIKGKNNISHTFSDSYDLVQTACLFLLEYVGMKLGDKVIDRYNKEVTIRHACYSEIGSAFYKRWNYHKRTYPISYKDAENETVFFEEDTSIENQERADAIVVRMNLKEKHKKVLDCYMQGMGVVEISKSLGIAYATVWRHRMLLQQRYIEVTGYSCR